MKELEEIKKQLRKEAAFADAARIVSFDQSTVCPEEGVEEKNEISHRAKALREMKKEF